MSFFLSCLQSSWNSRRGDAGHPASAPRFDLLCQKESTLGEEDEKQLFQHAVHAQCGKIPVRDNWAQEGSSEGICLSLSVIKCQTYVTLFSHGGSSDAPNAVGVENQPDAGLVSGYTLMICETRSRM